MKLNNLRKHWIHHRQKRIFDHLLILNYRHYIRSNLNSISSPHKKEKEDDILADLGITDESDEEEEEEEEKEEPLQNISKKEIEFEIKIWEMIRLFFNSDSCKDDIIKYLGFEKKELLRKQQEIENKIQSQSVSSKPNLSIDTVQQSPPKQDAPFDSDADDGGFDITNMNNEEEEDSDDEDFFNSLSQKPEIIKPVEPTITKIEEKKDESSRDEPARNKTVETIENRFAIPTETDNQVRNAIITGNYRLAIDLSLNAGNIADALVFAYYGKQTDDNLWQIASDAYPQHHSQQFITNTFKYIAQNDYNQLVNTSNLQKWRETLAILLTFTNGSEFDALCNTLGQRILETQDNLEGAIACFLCSHNISKLISIWTVDTSQKATDLILHSCITKALIYVNAPSVQDALLQNQ